MGFTNGTNFECMYTLSTAITKNTYTTEAAFTGLLGTNTVAKIPGNYLATTVPNPVGRSFKLDVLGTIANTAAATFAVALGTNPTAGTKNQGINVYAATAPTAATTTLWHCHVEYTVTAYATSTFSMQVNGFWTQSAAATGTALVATGLRMDFQGSQTGLDPRVDQYIELHGTWSASSASNTTTVQQMKLYGEN